MRTHTEALTVEVVRADVVGTGRVDVVVSLTAGHDVLVDAGEAELVRTLTLTRRERNGNGAGSTVSRRTVSVLGRVDLEAPGSMATGETRRLRAVVPVPGGGEASIAGELVQQDHTVRVRFRAGGDRVEVTRAVHVPLAPAPSPLGEPAATADGTEVAVLGFEDLTPHRLHDGVPVRARSPCRRRSPGAPGACAWTSCWSRTCPPRPGSRSRRTSTPRPWSPPSRRRSTSSSSPGGSCGCRSPSTSPTTSRLRRSGPRSSRCAGSCRPSSTGRCGATPG